MFSVKRLYYFCSVSFYRFHIFPLKVLCYYVILSKPKFTIGNIHASLFATTMAVKRAVQLLMLSDKHYLS